MISSSFRSREVQLAERLDAGQFHERESHVGAHRGPRHAPLDRQFHLRDGLAFEPERANDVLPLIESEQAKGGANRLRHNRRMVAPLQIARTRVAVACRDALVQPRSPGRPSAKPAPKKPAKKGKKYFRVRMGRAT